MAAQRKAIEPLGRSRRLTCMRYYWKDNRARQPKSNRRITHARTNARQKVQRMDPKRMASDGLLLKRTIIRHFADDFLDRDEDDEEDITLANALDVCSKATTEGRVPDAFYDELAQLADQVRGGSIQ